MSVILQVAFAFSFFSPITDNNFKEDSDFLKGKLPECTRWLETHGLEDLISIDSIIITNSAVSVILQTKWEGDSSIVMFENLKEQFLKLHPAGLEHLLLFEFAYLLELPIQNFQIEIYDQDPTKGTPCLVQIIYFDNQLITRSSNCRNQVTDITLPLVELPKSLVTPNVPYGDPEKIVLNSKKSLLEEIRTFCMTHFEQKGGLVDVQSYYPSLVFEVRNLRREVLYDEENPVFIRLLNKCCTQNVDWVRREMLLVSIFLSEKPGEITIHFDINGKFGSGIFEPRRSGYYEMEPEFTDYLQLYVRKLSQTVLTYLENG